MRPETIAKKKNKTSNFYPYFTADLSK